MKRKLFCFTSTIIVIIFIMSLTLAGCARSAASKTGVVLPKETSAGEPARISESAQSTSGEAVSEVQNQAGTNLPAISPKIIKTAILSIEVAKDTFEESMANITKIAESLGGYVSNTESYSDAEGNLTSGRIIARVPGDKFNAAIEEVKKAGKLKSINISGTDVTQEYIDLQSRLKNYQAQEKVLLDLMNKSTSVKDSIEVQKELGNVQGEIEVIKGRINYLDNMVGFSTIDVSISEPETTAPVQGGGFLNAVKRGTEGAIKVLNGLAFFFIAISPLLVLAGIIILIIWGSIRSRNKRRAKRAAEAAKLAQKE